MAGSSVSRELDIVAVIIALLIVTVGIFTIWSAVDGSWALKQLGWLGISVIVFMLVISVDYMWFCRYAYLIWSVCICLLLLVFFLPQPTLQGIAVYSWICLGPINIQPSEFAKVAVVVVLARYLMFSDNYKQVSGLIGPFFFTLVPTALILRQPDLGTAMVFIPTLLSILYVIGARKRHIISVILMGLMACPLLWFTVMKIYQKKRVYAFLCENFPFAFDPSAYFTAKQYQNITHQLTQGLTAIGDGQVFGRGWEQGPLTQSQMVPEQKADFVFTAIGEEWGFVGAMVLFALFLLLFLICFDIAERTREPFGRIVALGCTALLAVQTLINLAVNVGFLPTTGLTLPFISYGGSSLCTSAIALGLIFNVGSQYKVVLADEYFK